MENTTLGISNSPLLGEFRTICLQETSESLRPLIIVAIPRHKQSLAAWVREESLGVLDALIVAVTADGEQIYWLVVHDGRCMRRLRPDGWVGEPKPDNVQCVDEMLDCFSLSLPPLVRMLRVRFSGSQFDCICGGLRGDCP